MPSKDDPHTEIRPALRPGQQPTGTNPASWAGRRTNAPPSTTNAFRRLSHSSHDWTPSPRSGVNLTLPNLGESPNEQLDATARRPDADVRVNHGKPIPESKPARRAFNTPNAAGVSRDTDARPDSDQRPTGQPASSTSQRRDANGTTDCTTNADYRQAASKELAAKTKVVAARRRNPVKSAGHRSWFFHDSRNRPWPTHG